MLQQLLNFTDPKHMDASDALAVAVCHHFQQNSLIPSAGSKVNGWKVFWRKIRGRVENLIAFENLFRPFCIFSAFVTFFLKKNFFCHNSVTTFF